MDYWSECKIGAIAFNVLGDSWEKTEDGWKDINGTICARPSISALWVVDENQKPIKTGCHSQIGWICPRCGKGNAPFKLSCNCTPPHKPKLKETN